MLIRKIKTFFKNPKSSLSFYRNEFRRRIKSFCLKDGIYKLLPDKLAIKLKYESVMGEKLNLKNPKTFNQKLQWLKLYDRNPLYSKLVDKAEVKKYVAEKIGQEYVIPTYGVWKKPKQIEWDKLPNQFVIKCTHDSGSTIICGDKGKLDIHEVSEQLKRCLKKSQFNYGREWSYKKIKPRIIAEKFLGSSSGTTIDDYKVLCFNGEPKLIQFHHGRGTSKHTQDYYDVNWNMLDYLHIGHPKSGVAIPRPPELEQMLELSRILSENFIHIRVDWYLVDGKIYFGELTFFNGSGFVPFDNKKDDELIGSWINLPKKKRKFIKKR